MQSTKLHAKLPMHTAPVDVTYGDLVNNVVDPNAKWVPTVVNPSAKGGTLERGLFCLHFTVWVLALIFGCITNFGAAAGIMTNSSNATVDVDGNPTGAFTYDAYMGTTATTSVIGVLGGASSLVGVALLLGAAGYYDKEEFAGTGDGLIVNVFIQFFTLFGTVSTYYMFAQAAAVTSHWFYVISMFTIIFMTYAQVLLYCTSSAIGVAALPRAFIPSLAGSVQFISALAISSGDFAPAATGPQKTIAWLVPIFTVIALGLMFTFRIATQPGRFLSKYAARMGVDEKAVSNIKNRPFLRSVYLTPYMISGILSVYKLSFVKVDPDPTSYVFAFFGMLLNFAIIGVVFNPSAELVGIDKDPSYNALTI